MKDRPLVTVVGILAIGGGLAVVFAPELAGFLSAGAIFVKLVGVLTLVQGLRVVQGRRNRDLLQAETGDPETNVTLPTPGTEFDERLLKVHSGARKERFRARKKIRATLESSLVEAIVQREGCSRDEARAQVETGEWTDDDEAAAFLGGPSAPRRSWREWFRQSLGGQTTFQHRARRTADAVSEYVEETR
ncbi:hypothetical protein ACFFQF_04140 [Haladaptatus pallidirubidus]|uniref:Uncharacterized protein n=1 Tax=Haladaptatus pallidirubidus TaxID=1008152 RepID=A0AAV3UKS8_9EURY|nr:hypothetical protein [Haladaptatus pallidirubidus]